jgi:hypothetical protein
MNRIDGINKFVASLVANIVMLPKIKAAGAHTSNGILGIYPTRITTDSKMSVWESIRP